jgi:hypothetical protein
MRVPLAVVFPALVAASTFSFDGQASAWLGGGRDTGWFGRGGLRYVPEVRLAVPLGGSMALDVEASVNGSVVADARTFDRPEVEAGLKPYRLLVRVSAERFEARAGLQKLNFGSASLLRPLQWFDRLDPRDPLGMTDGVYGLLGRYYFRNNANLWAWGLIGNSSSKGWEQTGSERWTPEFGGRTQLPVPRGEVAATYHHRQFRASPLPEPSEFPIAEDRVGLDAKWDAGIGLWLEGAMARQATECWEAWQRVGTVGLDYTFGLGNGLTVIAEHLVLDNAQDAFGADLRAHVSAGMVNYPLGLLDNLRGMVVYDWSGKGLYRFVSWQRTLDRWLFSVAAFWTPDTAASFGASGGGVAGRGVQLMAAFNH